MKTMSMAVSQLSCFSSIMSRRRLQLHNRSYPCAANFRSGKVLNVMSSDGRGTGASNLENKTNPSYVKDASISHNEGSVKYPDTEGSVNGKATNGHVQDQVVGQPQRAAKIHDFCLGIPFGGLVLCGGLVGFIFSRNPVTLSTGVLFGGVLLALSTFSLKVWRQGKSSLPFILGQAALSIALVWKNFQTFQLTKNFFPAGFNAFISAAMLCFYSYVVLSGGNPPPKKSKSNSPAAVESY